MLLDAVMDDESTAFLDAIGRDPWEAITRPLPAQAGMDTRTLTIEVAMVCDLIGRDLDIQMVRPG